MLKIRLAKRGKKHYPTYRIVVAESKSPRDGKHVDDIGFYNPMKKPMELSINMEKLDNWMNKGAQPTLRVTQLIKYAKNPESIKKLDSKRDEFRKKRIHKKKAKEEIIEESNNSAEKEAETK